MDSRLEHLSSEETGTTEVRPNGGRASPDELCKGIAAVRAAMPEIIARGNGLQIRRPGVRQEKIRQGV